MISRPLRIAQLTTDARGSLVSADGPEPVFGTAPAALLEGFSRYPEELEVHVVSCVSTPVRAPAQLASNIFFHSLVVPRLGWLRTGFQGCVRATRRRLREIQPDLVHGQGTERDCALGAVFSGFPNLLTLHGNMRRIARLSRAPLFSYQRTVAWLERVALPRTDGLICITRHTQEEVGSLVRRQWIVPNPVDRSFFSIARRPVHPPVVLCVGSVSVIKNQNQLIHALAPLARDLSFTLAFHGVMNPQEPYGAEFQQLIREHPWCEYRGFADRAALKQILSEASVLVLPSLEENCPMVLLEAAAAGLPVVASRVGGIPELLEEGQTGFLVALDQPQDLADRVRRILEDPALGAQLSGRAKARALERFEPAIVARRHLEIYREVLGDA